MYVLVSGQNSAQPPSSSLKLTALALVNVQLNTDLSNNGLKKLVRTINQTSSSKMVEPNFYMNFLRAGQYLCDFFTCSDLKITDRKGDSGTVRVVAHCNYLSSRVNHVIQSSKISVGYFVKFGNFVKFGKCHDGGKGFLKFFLSIFDTALRDETSSPPLKQPLTQRTSKDTGVKRQILVGVSEDLPETHPNIEQIWSLINTN